MQTKSFLLLIRCSVLPYWLTSFGWNLPGWLSLEAMLSFFVICVLEFASEVLYAKEFLRFTCRIGFCVG